MALNGIAYTGHTPPNPPPRVQAVQQVGGPRPLPLAAPISQTVISADGAERRGWGWGEPKGLTRDRLGYWIVGMRFIFQLLIQRLTPIFILWRLCSAVAENRK